MKNTNKETITIRKRYDRIAGIYDRMEEIMERSRLTGWRELLWSKIEGDTILEIGVGTGKNFRFYPAGKDMTAIDFSDKMLAHARNKAALSEIKVKLLQMDVQDMEFPDDSFDTVVGTFVFCSVPDPIKGLQEVKRVVKPDGSVILLEHVLSSNRILAGLMNMINPVVVRTMGPNINRKTVENVTKSGLIVENVTELGAGIFKLIEARKKEPV